jgi:hypothetical protein
VAIWREQVEAAQAEGDSPQPVEELIADKGYHSNRIMVELDALGVRSYVAEPDRGRRDWSKAPDAQAPVYGNRRRIRGRRGRRLMRQRGERIERSFAHLYDTGGMRRTHLRGHTNILKRVLIHAGAFNLGLVMRHLIGVGTPRGLQGRLAAVISMLSWLLRTIRAHGRAISVWHRLTVVMRSEWTSPTLAVTLSVIATYSTGCYPADKHELLTDAFLEAWAWMESQGLIVRRAESGSAEWFRLAGGAGLLATRRSMPFDGHRSFRASCCTRT